MWECIINFVNNTSPDGGALALHFDVHFVFKNVENNPICLKNNFILFHRNVATDKGGSISSLDSILTFIAGNSGIVLFNQNTAQKGGAVSNSNSDIIFIGTVQFYGNRASLGGAIESNDGRTSFQRDIRFESDTANNGGAMALMSSSKLTLIATVNISFVLNSAYNTGGAIYFRDDQCPSEIPGCSLRKFYDVKNISLYFINNYAGSTGSTLYGKLNKCRPCYQISHESKHCDMYFAEPIRRFMFISTIILYNNSLTNISATAAERIRFCQDDEATDQSQTMHVYPGKQFTQCSPQEISLSR